MHRDCGTSADDAPEHDSAISNQNAAAKDINTKTSEHQRIAQELERKRAALNNIQHKVRISSISLPHYALIGHEHQANEGTREQKLNELHAPHETGVGAGAGTNGAAGAGDVGTGAGMAHHGTGVGQTGAGMAQHDATMGQSGAGMAKTRMPMGPDNGLGQPELSMGAPHYPNALAGGTGMGQAPMGNGQMAANDVKRM